ncbi:MAG: carbohydrate kinase [Bacteroidetes bacterium]|nr:carbohydrate kinase [Bacteroidota bacterium]MBL6944009.1 carbohydrate kinase [Bacteroidales bacterium]
MVYTLGESLLDIIISSIDDVVVRPGGAMLNAAVSLGRYDVEVSIITELGDDDTSELIISFLKKNNVVTDFVQVYNKNNTSLALAFFDNNKKPKYTFIKNYPDNRNFKAIPKFEEGDILLFGSLYSIDKQIRKSILSILNRARKCKAIIIYDPNIRNAHHLSNHELMSAVHQNIKLSHIIKGSDEDFANIFGTTDNSVQISEIRKINKEAFIIITLGADGVIADFQQHTITLPAYSTKVISTIGAGDAFNAGIIYALVQMKLQNSNFRSTLADSVENILSSGLNFAAKVCNSIDNYIPLKV